MQDRRERGGWGGDRGRQPAPHYFVEQNNFFFYVKSEDVKFLQVNNIWDFSLFIEQDMSDKK